MTDRAALRAKIEGLLANITPRDWLVLRRNVACVDVVIHPDGAAVGDEGKLIASFYDRGHADADTALFVGCREILRDVLSLLDAEPERSMHLSMAEAKALLRSQADAQDAERAAIHARQQRLDTSPLEEQLREQADKGNGDVYAEAADTITALRTELACAQQRESSVRVQYAGDKAQWQVAAQTERARAETINQRLDTELEMHAATKKDRDHLRRSNDELTARLARLGYPL